MAKIAEPPWLTGPVRQRTEVAMGAHLVARTPAGVLELFAQPVFLIRHVWVCFEKGYQGSDNASEGPRI